VVSITGLATSIAIAKALQLDPGFAAGLISVPSGVEAGR
jgi:hypothetical protein